MDGARARLDELGLPLTGSFDLHRFGAATAESLGLRIRLVPVRMTSLGGTSLLGMTDRVGTTHYVFYVLGMSELHGWHNAVHELGHLIWGHRGVQHYDGAEAEADALATVVLSGCASSGRGWWAPPVRQHGTTDRLSRAWG